VGFSERKEGQMNRPVDDVLGRDAAVLRVRGALAFTDASRPGAAAIADAAILVRDGKIASVGAAADPVTTDPRALEVGGDRYWIMPGLVNAHSHGRGLGWFRLGAPDDALEPWICQILTQPGLDPYLDTVYQNLRLIAAGVTTVLHSHYPRNPADAGETEATLRAYTDTRLRVGFAASLFTRNFFSYDDAAFLKILPEDLRERAARVGREGAAGAERFFAEVRSLTARYAGSGRGAAAVRILHGPVAPQWVMPGELARCRREADELGGGIHMHLLETPYQRARAWREYGRPWAVELDRQGILGPNVSLAHAVWTDDDDLACMAERGVTVCHNPSSNLRLKSGLAPVARMQARGIAVALGGDNSVLGGEEDMLAEMRLCANLHRQPGFETAAPGAEEVLAMATVAGAHAAGFGDTIGRIVPGAAADLVLLRHERITSPFLAPQMPRIDALLHVASARDVETVIIGGEVVYHAGAWRGFDRAKIEAELVHEAVASLPRRDESAELFRAIAPYRRRFEEQLFEEPAHYRYNAVKQ
jgi:5-methylthioadenosine/S-adenosylhomocysteine deaminase